MEIMTPDLVVLPFLAHINRPFAIWSDSKSGGSLLLLYYIRVPRFLVVYDHGHFVFCQKNLSQVFCVFPPFNIFKHFFIVTVFLFSVGKFEFSSTPFLLLINGHHSFS